MPCTLTSTLLGCSLVSIYLSLTYNTNLAAQVEMNIIQLLISLTIQLFQCYALKVELKNCCICNEIDWSLMGE